MLRKPKYKFTIIIPAYNASETIDIPLKSLVAQTNQDFEVIIVDDGSTDNTIDKVKPYLLDNPSWKIIRKQNGNWGSVMNHVISNHLIDGEFTTILDADDYFEPNILEKISEQSSDIIITDIYRQRKGVKKIQRVFFGKSGFKKPNTCHTPLSMPHGKFYRSELFKSLSSLVEGVSYQDTVLYNELLSKAKDVFYIREPLAIWWEDREGNSTTIDWDLKRADIWIRTCQKNVDIKESNEVTSWALLYLWELKRQYGKKTTNKVSLDLKKAKMLWLPFGTRTIAKTYFALSTKKYRN